MSLKDLDFIILDLQTTGFVPQYSDIVELAWMRGSGSRALHQKDIYCFTTALPEGKVLTRKIRDITGLRDEDFTDAKTLQEVGDCLRQTLQDGLPILSHYARFEKSFLEHHLKEIFSELDYDYICTFEVAKRIYPDLPCRNLPALAGYFGHPHLGKKRAPSHVEATHQVWRSLVPELEQNLGITSLVDLKEWLKEKSPKGSKKMQFQISKEVRDNIPPVPGVYRFINQQGEILYIGKAINLKQRLKSYFQNSSLRGRKREMMTQAAELRFDLAQNEVHAALIETDLIKTYSPPYNVALQKQGRELYFFSEDYSHYSDQQCAEFPNGPYTQPQEFAALQAIIEGSPPERINAFMFFGFVEPEEFLPGWQIFQQKYLFANGLISETPNTLTGVFPSHPLSMRTLLALGIKFYRYYSNLEEAEPVDEIKPLVETIEEELEAKEAIANIEMKNDLASGHYVVAASGIKVIDGSTSTTNSAGTTGTTDSTSTTGSAGDEDDVPYTPEEICAKIERRFAGTARQYLRAKEMTRLLNAQVHWTEKGKSCRLFIRDGQILAEDGASSGPSAEKENHKDYPWHRKTIADFDRLRVLMTELNIQQRRGENYRVVQDWEEPLGE